MIALLTGTPVFHSSSLIIDVHGVGYGVAVSPRTLDAVRGKPMVTLHIYTHVREEALELFGFFNPEERQLFLTLLSVSGVGPKTALAISSGGLDRLTKAVREGSVEFFTEFPRVGKKLAQKIIIELKPKLGSLQDLVLGEPEDPKEAELIQALQFLGYPESAVRQMAKDPRLVGLSIQDAIKLGIKLLSNKE